MAKPHNGMATESTENPTTPLFCLFFFSLSRLLRSEPI